MVFKKTLLTLALTGASCSVFANSVNLEIKGELITAACQPSLDSNVVDFDKINLSSMPDSGQHLVDAKDLNLTITCDNPAKVLFSALDNNPESRASGITIKGEGGTSFQGGLGRTSTDVKLGAYSIIVGKDAIADGISLPVIVRESSLGTTNWGQLSDGLLMTLDNSSRKRSFTVGEINGSTTPVAFTTATFPLKVQVALQDKSILGNGVTGSKLNGSTTFSISYL
ncbi:DUF1120 domain-containing protein [Entomohabitans teleogrylli]|uniref:DUF1120 domain-containing protein n=1 Tax=Entomohabitans teleogrylli TaxID=1384589 RepID=UPI00073DA504|nr:DUF1120 domain-containing protein [Entomohabitans teleogrylli]